jgi:signal transduction histidine kinase
MTAVAQAPRVRALGVDGRALVLFLLSGAAMCVAPLVEAANDPYTRNYRTPGDTTVVSALFTVAVVGLYVVVRRPGSRAGWVLLWSGLLTAGAGLTHALAVHMVLVEPTGSGSARVITWLATFLYVPAMGLLPFALAAHLLETSGPTWLRWATVVGVGALGAVTLAQAVAPDFLDGVAPSTPIANPAGIGVLADATQRVTDLGVVLLVLFSGALLVTALMRTVRGRGAPAGTTVIVAAVFLLLPVLATVARPWVGDWGWALAAAVLAPAALLASGVRVARRERRLEAAHAALIAERAEERRRLRRDLHDGLGPLLAALRLEVDADTLDDPPRVRRLVDDAVAEIRRISRGLRPPDLDEAGLPGALRRLATRVAGPGGLEVAIDVPAARLDLPAAVEVAAYRIAGEALTNAVRHAHARRITVTLRAEDALRLEVSDDGIGIRGDEPGVGLG